MKPKNIICVKPDSTVFGDQGSWINKHMLEVIINRSMFHAALERHCQGGKNIVSVPVHISIRLFGIAVSGAHLLITGHGLVCKFEDQELKESFSFALCGEVKKL